MSCAAYTLLGIYVAAASKNNKWIVRASLVLATVFFVIACYKAWAEQATQVDAFTSKANIVGKIFQWTITENPLGELPTSRVWLKALMVNKSSSVSPTVHTFICKMSLQDGEVIQAHYVRDLATDWSVTHRDEQGRQTGPYPSLAYFNDSGLAKDQHREGGLRFEFSGAFIRQDFADGWLELIVIDGGGNSHVIDKIKWPYIRRMVTE